jgi:hypothetical protein
MPEKFHPFIAIGLGLVLVVLAFVFWNSDKAFFDEASIIDARITDERRRQGSSDSSDTFILDYEFTPSGSDITWTGSDYWAERRGLEAPPEVGENIPVAFIYIDNGVSVESRLAEAGFQSQFPWGIALPGGLIAIGGLVWLILSRWKTA